ncbi:hypothetical protein D4Z77_08565, partial [Campylobacter coli]
HVQLLFTWNPSPLRPSKFSFEYLLLPPRSAPAAAPPGPAQVQILVVVANIQTRTLKAEVEKGSM